MFLEFISQNWLLLLALIGGAAVIIYLAITRQWLKVREFAYQAMLLAERVFGDQDGKIKFDFVVRIVYKYLPPWLKTFVTEDKLNQLIQQWYDLAKDFLDDGQINSSVK